MAILQRSVSNVSTTNPQPIVGQVLVPSQSKNDKFYSSKLLNYVESIEIDGFLKTVFFTEVNTNVNVGDRVFIVNGNYDSNSMSQSDKYRKYTDGYRVLSVNGCRIVLDIDYVDLKPYEEFTTRNFIFIHHIDNQKDFDYINSLKISIGGSSISKSIFNGDVSGDFLILECQNILFTTTSFIGSQNPDYVNGGVGGAGFWIRVDDGQNNNWLDITPFVISNQILQNNQFSDSGKLYIIGKKFTVDSFTFESEGIYKYENFTWKIDVLNYRPYISKLNFRGGKFSGTHNDGIFGSYLKKIFWNNSTWNSGVMINSDWLGGFMNSKHTVEELSFSGKIQVVGNVSTVIQTEDNTNNRGFGYNFVENSTFFTYSISNGNFYNCLFSTASQYKSALDTYYNPTVGQFVNVVNGGKYELCEMYDLRGNGGYFINSSIENSNINLSKLISSEVINSSVSKSSWSADGGIRILGADLWSYDSIGGLIDTPSSNLVGILKLYISEEDYFKLSKGDAFYIQKINKEVLSGLISDDEKILNNIETKFLIDNFDEWDLNVNQKSSISVSISSSNENTWKYVNRSNPDSFLPSFGYSILEDDIDYWYTLPLSKLKGSYNADFDTIVGYDLNDIVFRDLSFYQYIPYNRNVLPDIQRAQNNTEFDTFVLGHKGEGIDGLNGVSDWVFIGGYSGMWTIDGIYEGFYTPEVTAPQFIPSFASGSVVSDGVDIFSSNKFWIFVGQNEVESSYSGSIGIGIGLGNLGEFIEEEIPGQKTNAYSYSVVGKVYNNQNFTTTSNIQLPSINISTKLLAWYLDETQTFRFGRKNTIRSITPQNVNNLFLNTILGNGDFKSGVMEDSTWLSGDNTNYSNNIIETIQGGFLNMVVDTYLGKKVLKIKTKDRKFSNYLNVGYDYFDGDYIWLKSIKSIFNDQVTQIDGKYKVLRYVPSQSELIVESVDTIDRVIDLSSGTQFYLTDGKSNNYHSIHKFNLTNSKVVSGKFKRTGIDNTIFENELFKKYAYPTEDIPNTELIRLVNMMFQDTNNQVKSGVVYKSHFVNDIFNGGTFYNSFFLNGTFTDGLFKSSVWTGGNFNGGRFVDSRESTIFSFDFDTTQNNKLWQGGNFNGGEFYNSLWVRGNFNGGRFYFSDWTGGTWSNGVIGSKDLRTQDTTMAFFGPTTSFGATHTVWFNGLVENALLGGGGSIDWFGGKMIGGEFTSFGREGKTYSIWHDGDFYGSSFTRQAWWKSGNFYSGKFLSEIGWDKVNFLTYSNDNFDYGWVNGNFLGGEFGNANSLTNSVWYDGVMEGGVFQGRFWRDGLLTNGKFYGSFVTQSDISISLKSFTQSFYGLWNGGFVDSNVYNVKTDRIVATENLQISSKRTKERPRIVDMDKVVWKGGTFNHELSTFNDSVWLDGEFRSGNFNNSYFNPFVDLTIAGLALSDYDKSKYLKQINDEINQILSNVNLAVDPLSFYLDDIQTTVLSFNNNSQVETKFVVEYFVIDGLYDPIPPDFATLEYSYTDYNEFESLKKDISVFVRISDPEILILNPNDFIGISFYVSQDEVVEEPGDGGQNRQFAIQGNVVESTYPNELSWDIVPYSFNLSETCIWTGGNFNGGEFNYSVWSGGNFNDGVINGSIWKDGVFNYGFMNNCYWENGVWRNGNWNGSPFDYTNLTKIQDYWEISNKKVDQILKNISQYSLNTNIHLSNVLVSDPNSTLEHSFSADIFYKWVVNEQNISEE